MKKIVADSVAIQKKVSLLKQIKRRSFLAVLSYCLLLVAGWRFSAWATEEITPSAPVVQAERLYPETQIQGLYAPFKEEYKYLSPAMGLLVLNSGILANLRFRGKYGTEDTKYICHYQITHPGEDHLATSNVDCPQDYTSAVIQHFFPSPAGALLVTPALDKIDLISRISVTDIGDILKIYVQYRENLKNIENDSSKKQEIKKEYFEKFNAFFKDKLESLKNDKKAWMILEQAWGRAGVKLEELSQKYAEMFVEAAEERELYPAHIVEYTLMAYAWKKSSDAALIANQMKSMMNDKFKEFLLASSSPKENLGQNIKRGKPSSEEIEARKQAAALQKQNKSAPFSGKLYFSLKDQAIKDNYLVPEEFQKWLEESEKLIFMTLGYDVFENDYPPLLGTGIAIYQNIEFSDCGESALLNFFNVLIADSANKSFNVDALTSAFPNARPSVVKFYKKYQPLYANVVDTSKQRSLWAEAISGLSPQKVEYRNQTCNIKGTGIDNMLAVLEEILNDPALISIQESSIEETRAKKLTYIFEKLNEEISWFENGQSSTISLHPKITLLVNNKERFLWTFEHGHFTLLPIQDVSARNNWLLNGSEGARLILTSSLPDDLKRLALPFYHGEDLYKAYENNIELRNSLKKFLYELIFGSSLQGKEQLLTSLNYLLTLDQGGGKIKDLSFPWVRKMFNQRDEGSDIALISLLFKYKDTFPEDYLAQDLSPDIASVYHNILKELESLTPKGQELLLSYFDKCSYAEQLIIHTLSYQKDKTNLIEFFSKNKIFHKVAENGNENLLKFLIKIFPNFDSYLEPAQDYLKRNPLHLAALKGHLGIVKFLLEIAPRLASDPGIAKDGSGNTPLFLAASMGHLDIVKFLFEKAPQFFNDPQFMQNDINQTPLSMAIYGKNLKLVEFIIEKAPHFLNRLQLIKGHPVYPPLHSAANAGDLNIFKFLVEKAPSFLTDPQLVKNSHGNTPLSLAAFQEHLEIVKFIVEKAPHLIMEKNDMGKLASDSAKGETRTYLLEQEKLYLSKSPLYSHNLSSNQN